MKRRTLRLDAPEDVVGVLYANELEIGDTVTVEDFPGLVATVLAVEQRTVFVRSRGEVVRWLATFDDGSDGMYDRDAEFWLRKTIDRHIVTDVAKVGGGRFARCSCGSAFISDHGPAITQHLAVAA